jgi:hypothetical protein
MRHYCTSTDHGYLRRTLALHGSLEAHCQPYHLWVLALEDGVDLRIGMREEPNLTVVPLAEVETAVLRAARPSREWREYVWTLKAEWIMSILQRGVGAVTYIDGDGFFFADPEPLYAEIGDAPLAVTPHRFSPGLEAYRKNGRFNGGFIYASLAGLDCLQEWAAQCLDWCHLAYDGGRFVDQGYLDAWPEKWGAHAVQQKGVNLAPWNHAQYGYELRGGRVWVDGDPLIWFHFHQGVKPAYNLLPFVAEHIYAPYAAALGAVQC